MQRFLRDPRGTMPEASLSGAYGERIALIRKHFAPGVAAAYAIPRIGEDGALEWWTTQQGMVTPYAALNGDAQQALLRAYEAHLATLDGLVEAMRARGMEEQAGRIQALRTPPDTGKLYSADGRLLILLQDEPAPPLVAAAPVAPSVSRWRWILAASLLLLAALLAALWWWHRLAAEPPPVAAPAARPPAPKPEPVRDPEWPTELVVILETAARMKSPPETIGGPPRLAIGRSEIERIIGKLPADTNTQLVTFPPAQCKPPQGHRVYQAENRADLLSTLKAFPNGGKAALTEGLRLATASVDGIKRDALVFMFVGGVDECGQDLCAAAVQLAKEKPRLRINIVDLSGTQSVAACLADQARVGSYVWNRMESDRKGVDLSSEAARQLKPAEASAKGGKGAPVLK